MNVHLVPIPLITFRTFIQDEEWKIATWLAAAWIGRDRCGLSEVCRRLHDAGIPTATGKRIWSREAVWHILPCAGMEFPVTLKSLFRPHYLSWSEQRKIEVHAQEYLRNIVRIITETGLRVYKELMPMKKSQLDLQNAVVWIPDSKTPNGVAEVPLTPLAVEAFRDQFRLSSCSRPRCKKAK